jgi:hypothetical protein
MLIARTSLRQIYCGRRNRSNEAKGGYASSSITCSIAYDEQYAARFEESFLWLRGHRRSAEDFGPSLAGAGHSFRCYELEGRLMFPLDVPTQAAREVIVQSLTAQVEGIAELLQQGDPP